jgi:hypothetical protein
MREGTEESQEKVILDNILSRRPVARQRQISGVGTRATVKVVLEAVFSMWSAARLYHATDRAHRQP